MTRARWLGLQALGELRSLARDFVLVLLIAAAVWFAWPWLREWVAASFPSPAPAQVGAFGCAPPTEHEQLHVVITRYPDGTLVPECMYLGPRGAYRRTRHGLPEPRP